MQSDPRFVAEALYAKPWPNAKNERKSLALDESMGRVRSEYAAWVRGGRKTPV